MSDTQDRHRLSTHQMNDIKYRVGDDGDKRKEGAPGLNSKLDEKGVTRYPGVRERSLCKHTPLDVPNSLVL